MLYSFCTFVRSRFNDSVNIQSDTHRQSRAWCCRLRKRSGYVRCGRASLCVAEDRSTAILAWCTAAPLPAVGTSIEAFPSSLPRASLFFQGNRISSMTSGQPNPPNQLALLKLLGFPSALLQNTVESAHVRF